VKYKLLVPVTLDRVRRLPGEVVELPPSAVEAFLQRGYAELFVEPEPEPVAAPKPAPKKAAPKDSE
jgi:hypothetical protein